MIFHAANSNVATDYPLQKITVNGVPVDIDGGPVILCGGRAVATRTPRQIQNALTGTAHSDVAAGPATRTADSSCDPFADDVDGGPHTSPSTGSSTPSSGTGAILGSLSTITTQPVFLSGAHLPGTSVDATFRFAGIEPMNFRIPVTVPWYWSRDDVR